MPNVLSGLRDHLVAQGIVRRPSVAGTATPLWLEPQLGTPAPGEKSGVENDNDLVLGAFLTGGFPASAYESEWRSVTLDIRYRGMSTITIEQKYLDISRDLLDRRDFMLGSQYVIEVLESRPLQRLGSDEQGYDFVSSLLIELMR